MSKATDRGKYYEAKSKKRLEEGGWIVEKAIPKVIWIKGRPISMHHDFFGLFDLIAVYEDQVRFIQVKFMGENTHESGFAELREKIKKFHPGGELWIWKKKGRKAELSIEFLGQER